MATSALDLVCSGSKRSAAVRDKDSDPDKTTNGAAVHVLHYEALLKRKQAALSNKAKGALWWQYFDVVLESAQHPGRYTFESLRIGPLWVSSVQSS